MNLLEFINKNNFLKIEDTTTFFDIAKFAHMENVISNFYAYYFNPNQSHGFNDLFLKALISLINSEIDFGNVNFKFVKREYYNSDGKFIDIIIYDYENDYKLFNNVIIIENKIRAALYNDLINYYEKINVTSHKLLIVLSFENNIFKENYINNINHLDLIHKVESLITKIIIKNNYKNYVILSEFIQNIKNMSNNHISDDQLEFYLLNRAKLIEIEKLNAKVKNNIIKKVEDVCLRLNQNLVLQAIYNHNYRYFYSRNNMMYYSVWLSDYFNGDNSIEIKIELNENGIKKFEKLKNIIFNEQEKSLIFEKDITRKTYLLFSKVILIIDNTNIKDLTNFILDNIENTGLKSMFDKLEKSLDYD